MYKYFVLRISMSSREKTKSKKKKKNGETEKGIWMWFIERKEGKKGGRERGKNQIIGT